MSLTLHRPLVAIGAPVATYYPMVAERLHTRLCIPPHAEIANAIGAVVGSVMQTIRALVKPLPEEAGFRPCLRCRPDSAPGSPAWIGTHVTVRRALRAIAAGALDPASPSGGSVAALAASLGVGDRHLRRLMKDELGASPLGGAPQVCQGTDEQ